MARPYSAGGVSIAQGAGAPTPSLLLPTVNHAGFGAGERVRERGPDLGALSPAYAFLNEHFIPLRLGNECMRVRIENASV
jgi:hypothetical protein